LAKETPFRCWAATAAAAAESVGAAPLAPLVVLGFVEGASCDLLPEDESEEGFN
jgi:hypothetical protein